MTDGLKFKAPTWRIRSVIFLQKMTEQTYPQIYYGVATLRLHMHVKEMDMKHNNLE